MGPPHVDLFLKANATASAWHKPLLLSHTKPDCDALASLLVMRSFLRAQGIEPLTVQFDAIPPRYVALRHFEPMAVWEQDVSERDLADVDGVVVLDTCSYNQLEPLADWLRAARLPKLAVDHHVTRDDLADVYVIDESASSTCLILYDWARAIHLALDGEALLALFVGIATDTGWFRHANTDARTLSAAAELADQGVNVNEVFRKLYETDSVARIRLLGLMLDGMELYADDRVAVQSIAEKTIQQLGGRTSDTEDVINEPLRIESVRVSVMLVEQTDGPIRVSFRSKPPANDEAIDVDVAAVAAHFGGGGHRRAAGARISGSVESVRQLVLDHIKEVLDK
jgi:phosphoesterase RecJ-like protein